MHRYLPFCIIAILTFSVSVTAKVPSALALKGSGVVRYLGIYKVYDAYLYTEKTAKKKDILSPSLSKCIQVKYNVEAEKKYILKASNAVLKRQNSTKKLKIFEKQINQVHQKYRTLKDGDTYELCYDKNTQKMQLILNNKVQATLKKAGDFSSLYFGLWLSKDQPIDDDLREDLIEQLI